MARKHKAPAVPTLAEAIAAARQVFVDGLTAIDSIKIEDRKPDHRLDRDPDLAAAEAAVSAAGSIFWNKGPVIGQLRQAILAEEARRWSMARAVSGEEFEEAVSRQQAENAWAESFCRHCGRGYMHMHWNEVAEDGSIIKDNGRCRCGRNDFVYRKHPNAPEPIIVQPCEPEAMLNVGQPTPPRPTEPAAPVSPPRQPNFFERMERA